MNHLCACCTLEAARDASVNKVLGIDHATQLKWQLRKGELLVSGVSMPRTVVVLCAHLEICAVAEVYSEGL